MIVRRSNPSLEKPWQASFEHAEVKNGGMLTSAYGQGKTPNEALEHYVHLIAGETLVFGAYTDDRNEVNVPKNIQV